ncbi:MAG: hypothetical protein F4X29_03010 [Rhodothermaceae bacterium]|nr:hypothetical protein [Rhodothermaceae bacterium]
MENSQTELESRIQSLETTVERCPTKADVQKFKMRARVSVVCMGTAVFAALVSGTASLWSVILTFFR